MHVLPWVLGALGVFGSVSQANAQKKAASDASSAASTAAAGQSQLDQALAQIYNQRLADYAKNYQPYEAALGAGVGGPAQAVSGLMPGLTLGSIYELLNPDALAAQFGKAQGQLDTSFARGVSDIRNQLGGSVPNLGGTISDLMMSKLGQTTQLADTFRSEQTNRILQALGVGQQADTALQDYVTGGQNMLSGAASGISGLANQYAQAGAGAASNLNALAQQPSPYTGLANLGASLYSTFNPTVHA